MEEFHGTGHKTNELFVIPQKVRYKRRTILIWFILAEQLNYCQHAEPCRYETTYSFIVWEFLQLYMLLSGIASQNSCLSRWFSNWSSFFQISFWNYKWGWFQIQILGQKYMFSSTPFSLYWDWFGNCIKALLEAIQFYNYLIMNNPFLLSLSLQRKAVGKRKQEVCFKTFCIFLYWYFLPCF